MLCTVILVFYLWVPLFSVLQCPVLLEVRLQSDTEAQKIGKTINKKQKQNTVHNIAPVGSKQRKLLHV
jgi:hypothetical protein